ncbi:hypothetical protein [uncultured Oscillibacter sp.]|uniref:hypothetical protein n=1 Tax=uncultured Oscillibacter sp. TaxID=876091 RepID=UPI0025D8F992|nr:hypothetical protein [uncultured Oscillibacter sp.]
MKKKKTLYVGFIVVGLFLAAASLLLRGTVPDSAGSTLMGSGSGMAAIGLTQLLMLHLDQKDPAQARKKEIEETDERNVAIRRRAKALSGDVLQWAVIAAAWVSLGFDAPLWVTLAAIVTFVAKSALEVYLVVRYQREM